jgi:hypothetical protein
MNVRYEQRHRPALGDLKGLIEIALRAFRAGARAGETAQPGAGKETTGKAMLRPGAAEAGDSALEGFAERSELVQRFAL